jgi:hypothetical protein
MSGKKLPLSSLTDFIPSIPSNDRLWLEVIYESNRQNRRISTRQIRSQLRDQLPRNYDPNGIDRRLIHPSHEEITPLGIIAITGNEDLLEKGDMVIRIIQDILLDHPDIERVDTSDIANRSGLPENEIGLLCHFLWYYGKPFQSYGSKTPGYFGAEFVMFDRYNTDAVMQLTSMKETLIAQLEREEDVPEEDAVNGQGTSTALQVLAVHYLLKACGVESTEYKTETARLVKFLTGKEAGVKRIQDTNIYKKVRQPFKLNDKSVLQDLQTIRPLFVNLGLDKGVNLIDHEIKTCQGQGNNKGKS